jgi:hypothetical protein
MQVVPSESMLHVFTTRSTRKDAVKKSTGLAAGK